MRWHVDESVIELRPANLGHVALSIDATAVATVPLATGRALIPWKERKVELRIDRAGGGYENALLVDGQLIPPSLKAPRSSELRPCTPHDRSTKQSCPDCRAAICDSCLAADGVRCRDCLAKAARQHSQERRKQWLIGAAVAVGLSIVCGVGLLTHGHPHFAKAGGVMLFVAILMGTISRRKQGQPPSRSIDLTFDVREREPQLVGKDCHACRERIGIARTATWCRECHYAFHNRCATEHDCRLPVRGPDWSAIRGHSPPRG